MRISTDITESAVRVAMEGRLDAAWSEPASTALEQAIRSGRSRIELDLAGVSYISSVGIGVLLKALSRFRAVGGTLAVVGASEPVRAMLRVAKLERLLLAGAPDASAPERGIATTAIGSGWTGQLAHAAGPGAGTVSFIASGRVRAGPGTIALGHLALAADEPSAHGLFGDGLAVGGTIAVAPADAPRPDCLASGDGDAVECIARDALVAEGVPAMDGHFEWDGKSPVALSEIAAALVGAARGPVAFVAAGECGGAFGAWARSSPDGWASPPSRMTPAELRAALRYAGEPMHRGESLVAVAVAAAPDGAASLSAAVRDALVEQGGVLLHAHAAVASYRPVPRSTRDLAAAGRLLAEQPLRAVLHALRTADGTETTFLRGCVWAIPVGGAR